jgi:hypothetical protein
VTSANHSADESDLDTTALNVSHNAALVQHHPYPRQELIPSEKGVSQAYPPLYLYEGDEPSNAHLSVFSDVPPCPNPRTHREHDRITGEWVDVLSVDRNGQPLRCARNACPSCVVINARKAAHAIALSEPSHSLFISLVGADYNEIKKKMGRLIEYVHLTETSFQWVWMVEANPGGTGNHVHGFCHASKGHKMVSRPAIINALFRAGFRLPSGELPKWTLRNLSAESCAEYLQYPMKSLIDPELAGPFLELNSTKKRHQFIHASNRFWRDGANGPTLKTRPEAESLSYRRAQVRARATRLALLEGSSVDPQRPNGST